MHLALTQRIHRRRRQRAGTTLVECAVIYPLTFLLLLGLVIGAAGIFRYQQMAHLARQGARYAITHGTQWAKDTGNTAATPADIYNNAILPNAVGLDTTQLSSSVTWNTSNDPYHTTIVNGGFVVTGNTVSVTVSYQWIPEAFLGGVQLSSTSVMPMAY
jgi:Flp pilus assembly protein TadG